ncbi:PRTRC system protein E [Acidicapsa dinghuensis]|uniref:PRTRC system protein E n=1 Tax=Acidicapsa dinghuensis TaxID=2218256 RepID=A0ABW1ECQ1_9BACT|nr:PRTRC system protein E [Acidicapsa dinghuensis]
MFKELAPLLQQRSLVILANPLEGDVIRVIVMPKRLNDSENAALSTPVSVTGTPAELDEQLPSTLTQFVGAHLDLKNTLEIAKEEMAEAAKAARQGAKAKTASKPETSGSPGAKTAETKPAKEAVKPEQPKKPAIPTTANLFDFGAAPTAASVAAAPATTSAAAPVESSDDAQDDEEILAEIAENEPSDDELDPAA